LAYGTGLELDKAITNPTGNRARSDAGSLMKNVGIPQTLTPIPTTFGEDIEC